MAEINSSEPEPQKQDRQGKRNLPLSAYETVKICIVEFDKSLTIDWGASTDSANDTDL